MGEATMPRRGLQTLAQCACRRFEFRGLALVTDIAGEHAYCPKCRREVLIIRRPSGHVATIPYNRASVATIAHSLKMARAAGIRITEAEVAKLVEAVAEIAGVYPPKVRHPGRGRKRRADIDAAVVEAARTHSTLPVRAIARELRCSPSSVSSRAALFGNSRPEFPNTSDGG